MLKSFIKIASGRSRYSTYFLLLFCIVVPVAFFTQSELWVNLAWIMLGILGLFVSITGLITFNEARRSHNWPQAYATLKECSLISTSGSGGSRSYAPKIVCSFTAKGKNYIGTQYDLSAAYGSKVSAEKKCEEIKNKAEILRVYYKPDDPSINVIHPGVKSVHYLRMLIGPSMAIIAAFGYLDLVSYLTAQ